MSKDILRQGNTNAMKVDSLEVPGPVVKDINSNNYHLQGVSQ
jgi:hypothetical protein